MALSDLLDYDADRDHKPDVSVAAEANIEYGDVASQGTCCRCQQPIAAVYDGIDDDPTDTGWHHVDVVAVLFASVAIGARPGAS